MNKNKFIILTGAANSGKSTLARNIAEALYNDGFNPVFLHSPARSILAGPKPLKDIRKNPRAYLNMQEKIFDAQLNLLLDAYMTKAENDIFIFDRFILDTFMYLSLYCEPTGIFKAKLLKKKEALKLRIFDNAVFFADTVNPLFIHCKPIPVTQFSEFRPDNMCQDAEDIMLQTVFKHVASYCTDNGRIVLSNLYTVDARSTDLTGLREKIYSYLNN